MRRVVVTGLGMVSPLGGDVETSWRNILASKSGAGPITRFDASDQKCRIACEVKPADHEYGFDPAKRVDHKVQRQVDPFIVYGIDAAGQALEDAGLTDMSETADRVKKIVVEHLGVEAEKVTEEASFIDDLGADSLDIVELVMAFEEEFGVEIPDDAAEKITTVRDAIDYIDQNKG